MSPRSLFLRLGTVLPKGCSVFGKTVCDGWMSVDSENTGEVDARVRAVGWHFMWLTLVSSRAGIGLTSNTAISKAKVTALHDLQLRFNAAELISVRVSHYLGLYVARVKFASRHIQECASLGLVDEAIFRRSQNGTAPQAG